MEPITAELERAAYCAQTADTFRAYAAALEEELEDMGEQRAEAENLAERLATAEQQLNGLEADNAELEATICRLENALQDAGETGATAEACEAVPAQASAICSAGLPTVANNAMLGDIIELRTVDATAVRVARTQFENPGLSILATFTRKGGRKGGRGIHRGNLLTDGAELTPGAVLESALKAAGWKVARYPRSAEQRAKLAGMGFDAIIQTAPGQFEPHPLGLAWAKPGEMVDSGEQIAQPAQKSRTAWAEFNGARLGSFPRVELLINDHAAKISHYAARIYARGATCNTSAFKPAGWQEIEETATASGEAGDVAASGEEKTDTDDTTPAELCDDIERATYSPEDNKIRLYPARRLDPELYKRVKAAGFSWAPKQGFFVAPMWTPARADLAESLAGEMGDEDTTLAERAADRADRFEDYQGKRAADAESARRAVDAIAQNIPFGQPILVGHHSERHARRDAQRIEDGMRRAVKMWDTAEYWTRRAAGAIAHARYKELPSVRARRIKTIEAAQRKNARALAESKKWLHLWTMDGLTLERARTLSNACWFTVMRDGAHNWTAYDVLRPDGERSAACPAWTVDQVQDAARRAYPRSIAHAERWDAHYQNRLAYERAMLDEQGAGHLLEKKKRPVPAPLLNVRAPGGVEVPKIYSRGKETEYLPQEEMTKAEFMAIYESYRGVRHTADGWRVRVRLDVKTHGLIAVFLTDSKEHPRPEKAAPAAAPTTPDEDPAETDQASSEEKAIEPAETVQASSEENHPAENIAPIPEPAAAPAADPGAAFAAMRESLRAGVQVVAAPQLFPTPAGLAARMVELADIQSGARVLEPSAGTGRLIGAMGGRMFGHNPERGAVHAVEINPSLAGRLRAEFPLTTVHCADFLDFIADDFEPFDCIIMNPPFINGADIQHIKHAASLLKPGGRLVALCANGPRQRAQLMPLADTWEDLPAGTFSESGTGVNVALLVIDAPEATGTDDATRDQASGEEKTAAPSGAVWRASGFDPTTATGYAKIAGNPAALLWCQDTLDNFFGSRLVDIRNALRGLGWEGGIYPAPAWPLTKGSAGEACRMVVDVQHVGAGGNLAGITWRVLAADGAELARVVDALTLDADAFADALDIHARRLAAPRSTDTKRAKGGKS